MRCRIALPSLTATLLACSADPADPADEGGLSGADTGNAVSSTDAASGGTRATATATADDGGSSAGDGAKFDVPSGAEGADDGGPTDVCKVSDELDAPGVCDVHAPADSFTPEVQWTWDGPPGQTESSVIPLVANLTDDNGDGEIDLCDIPDVVVMAGNFNEGHLWVLDGETGAEHFMIPTTLYATVTPALGDLDGDGLPEIVALTAYSDPVPGIIAFEHDGTIKWQKPLAIGVVYSAIALADLDADGDVEILLGNHVFDHEGNVVLVAADSPGIYGDEASMTATTAADLDGDGDLEIVFGRSAYHHDGAEYYYNANVAQLGFPQIANLDDDDDPEVLVTSQAGLSLLEHDGTAKYLDMRPTNEAPTSNYWLRPATVHDFDGDGEAEFAMCSRYLYSVYERDATIVWSAMVSDDSGVTAGTAFDFLGDGSAEAMYTDEVQFQIYDSGGNVLLSVPRSSWTNIEYPIVVDVDNDQSAEILVVSATGSLGGVQNAPTLQVIRDAQDRWVPARRIWNQHTYHVTNVREDGTIPQHEPPHWHSLNTFRTQAQSEDGVCLPEPVG